jgi:hypothetical protein
MPRKQRFKPSRKPKPQLTEVAPPNTQVVQHRAEDIETAQAARSQRDASSVIEESQAIGK